MKHTKNAAIFLALILLLTAFSGCGKTGQTPAGSSATPSPSGTPGTETSPTAKPDETAIVVTDMLGREITLEEPASRIVALTPSDCEILYAIGAGDTLVGRGEYCDYPADVSDISSVQSGADTNIEQIIALKPQVLLMSSMAQTDEQIAALEKAGIKVVVSDAQNIEGVYTAIDLIGTLMGKTDEADKLISSMKETFADVSAKADGDGKKTIYFEVSPLEYGLWAAGKGTFMNEVAEMLGLTNIFADVDSWSQISEEQVIERNPDYIVTIGMYSGQGATPEQEIAARAGWENITAVKNGAILDLPNNELSRPGPRLADGAKKLYQFVYETAAGAEGK